MEPVLPIILIVVANFALYWVFWGNKKFQSQNNFLKQDLCAEESTNHCQKKFNKKLEGEDGEVHHR